MPKDTSPNRTYEQLPDTVIGTDAGGNPQVQKVSVNAAYPGIQVIVVSGAAEQITVPPYGGQLVLIDARNSPEDVLIRSKPFSSAILPSEQLATVLAGTYGLVLSDGSGWRNVPDAGTDSGKSTLTSALARGVVEVDVPALATFAVAGRDGITYREDDLVILNQQAVPAQNGPYIVGVVAAGNAPLTRPSWWAHGSIIPENFIFRLSSEGTVYGGLVLASTCLSQKLVDTDDPLLQLASVGALIVGANPPTFTFQRGFLSATRNADGDFTVAVRQGFIDPSKCTVALASANGGSAQQTFDVVATTATTIRVQTRSAGVLANFPFTLQLTRFA